MNVFIVSRAFKEHVLQDIFVVRLMVDVYDWNVRMIEIVRVDINVRKQHPIKAIAL